MNPNESNNKQSNSKVPRVAPPVVKPPVAPPPVVKPPVAPLPVTNSTIVKPKLANDTIDVQKVDVNNTSENLVSHSSGTNTNELNVTQSVEKTNQMLSSSSTVISNNELQNKIKAEVNVVTEVDDNKVVEDNLEKTENIDTVNLKTEEKLLSEGINEDKILEKYLKREKRKKVFMRIFAIALAMVFIVLLIKILPLNKKTTNKKEEVYISSIFDKNNYIAVKGDKGYGYINSKGKIVITPQYKQADDFNGDYAIVELNTETPTYNVIDKKGKVIESSSFKPSYYVDYGVWEINNKLYNEKLELISKDGHSIFYISSGYFYYQDYENNNYGILNSKGKYLLSLSVQQEEIAVSNNKYEKNDVYAIIKDGDGNVNITSIKNSKNILSRASKDYDIIHIDNNIFKIYNKVDATTTWVYIKNNKIVYEEADLTSLSVYNYEDEILVAENAYGKYFYDLKTKEIKNDISTIGRTIGSYYGYDLITENNFVGIEKNGKTVLDPKYTNITFLYDNLFNYIKNDRNKEFVLAIDYNNTYLIDINNDKVIMTFDSINYILFQNTTFIRLDILDENGNLDYYLIYNLMTGQKLKVELDENVNFGVNYVTITDGKKKKYYNNVFEKIYEERL